MNLEYEDFCYAVNNKKPKFSHEVLYFFNIEYELDKWGELVSVDITSKLIRHKQEVVKIL